MERGPDTFADLCGIKRGIDQPDGLLQVAPSEVGLDVADYALVVLRRIVWLTEVVCDNKNHVVTS